MGFALTNSITLCWMLWSSIFVFSIITQFYISRVLEWLWGGVTVNSSTVIGASGVCCAKNRKCRSYNTPKMSMFILGVKCSRRKKCRSTSRMHTAYYAVCILDVDRINTAYASAITPAMLFNGAVHTTMHCIVVWTGFYTTTYHRKCGHMFILEHSVVTFSTAKTGVDGR